MEFIAFILVLAIVFAAKSVAILREQDDEIAKSASFSWVKPGAYNANLAVPEAAEETEAVRVRSTAWKPSLAGKRVAIAR